MTHQERADMISSRISVPLATKSPCAQSCSRPYGLSVVSGVVGVAINGLSSSENDQLLNRFHHWSVSRKVTANWPHSATGLPPSLAGMKRQERLASRTAASSSLSKPLLL